MAREVSLACISKLSSAEEDHSQLRAQKNGNHRVPVFVLLGITCKMLFVPFQPSPSVYFTYLSFSFFYRLFGSFYFLGQLFLYWLYVLWTLSACWFRWRRGCLFHLLRLKWRRQSFLFRRLRFFAYGCCRLFDFFCAIPCMLPSQPVS